MQPQFIESGHDTRFHQAAICFGEAGLEGASFGQALLTKQMRQVAPILLKQPAQSAQFVDFVQAKATYMYLKT
jgi:hypothetical protein